VISLNKDSVNQFDLTLTEKTTVSNVVYLFEFKSDQTKERFFCIIEDTSLHPARYNAFTFTEGNDVPLDGELVLGETGFYHYTVYEQTSTTNLDPDNTDGIVELGKMKLIGDDQPVYVGYDPDEGVVIVNGNACLPATVKNSNNSYNTTAASGYTFSLPDINFTDSDGSTASVPSMEDLVCTPSGSCADADIEINGTPFTSVASGATEDIIVKDTDGVQVGSKVGSEWIVPLGNPNYTIDNSDDSFSQVINSDTTLTDINVTDSDGSTSAYPSNKDYVCTPSAKDITFRCNFAKGVYPSSIVTITSNNAGTYTSIADDGASGTITLSINGGSFVAFSSPLVLVATDTIQFKRTLITASGYTEITGTYV